MQGAGNALGKCYTPNQKALPLELRLFTFPTTPCSIALTLAHIKQLLVVWALHPLKYTALGAEHTCVLCVRFSTNGRVLNAHAVRALQPPAKEAPMNE